MKTAVKASHLQPFAKIHSHRILKNKEICGLGKFAPISALYVFEICKGLFGNEINIFHQVISTDWNLLARQVSIRV